MSAKEAKNDVAVEKNADNDVADAKTDKGNKRTADVSFNPLPTRYYFLIFRSSIVFF